MGNTAYKNPAPNQMKLNNKKNNHLLTQMIAPNFTMKNLSGYSDSNGGPPAPKAGALSQLRHTPNPLERGCKCKTYFCFCKITPLFFIPDGY